MLLHPSPPPARPFFRSFFFFSALSRYSHQDSRGFFGHDIVSSAWIVLEKRHEFPKSAWIFFHAVWKRNSCADIPMSRGMKIHDAKFMSHQKIYALGVEIHVPTLIPTLIAWIFPITWIFSRMIFSSTWIWYHEFFLIFFFDFFQHMNLVSFSWHEFVGMNFKKITFELDAWMAWILKHGPNVCYGRLKKKNI